MRKPSNVIAVGLAMVLTGISVTNLAAATFNDLATFQAATANLKLVNFDTDPEGNPMPSSGPIGSTYASLGVVFPPGNDFSSFIQPVSLPNGWVNNTQVMNGIYFDAVFTAADITAVGMHNVLYSSMTNGAILRAFDASYELLELVISDEDGNTLDFFGLTTTSPIARITVVIPQPSGWGLDDLYFGQVPEPAGILLLGLGGMSLLWRRR